MGMTFAPPSVAHVASYYAVTANPAPRREPLVGDARADVCVIGAGFTGISAALELVERGYSVIVLEGNLVGWGASGRNGGQLVNGYSRSIDQIGRHYGPQAESALGAMALDGAQLIRERVERYAIECELVDGNLIAAVNARQMRDLVARLAVWHGHGHDAVSVVDGAELRAMVDTRRYVGGLLDMRGGHFHSLNYLLGEAAAVESLGGRIHERSRMLRLERSGGRPVAITDAGRVTADKILLCGNAYLGSAVPDLSARIMPVSSQIVVTEPLGALAEQLLPSNYCVEDGNYIPDYYRRTADGRILFGGGSVYGGSDPRSIGNKIRPRLVRVFPALGDVRLDFAWSGNFALTLTRFPQLGRLSPDVYFSHGDNGHGVTTTQLLGKLLAEGVAGQMARFDAFADLPYLAFPGGRMFRVPLTVAGSWYYMLRDKLGR